MSITVGLDFGTHQTKICIENSNDGRRKTYEFWEWENGMLALPTVIQVNDDDTLRYGSVDMSCCKKEVSGRKVAKPKLKAPTDPEPLHPSLNTKKFPPPISTVLNGFGEKVRVKIPDLYGVEKPVPSGAKAFRKIYDLWEKECVKIKYMYYECLEKCKNLREEFGEHVCTTPPTPTYPEEPIFENDPLFKPWLVVDDNEMERYAEWRASMAEDEAKYEKAHKEWKRQCDDLQAEHDDAMRVYEESLKPTEPIIYRDFKYFTFIERVKGSHIPNKDLSVLYLAYIIFHLEERFGTDFSIQMGVPASKHTYKRLKQEATVYLIKAYKLVEEVFENDLERFLATPYEKLLSLIPDVQYSDEIKMEYAILIFPEAYAALHSLTASKKIPEHISLMVDIGGGSTDISLFTVDKKHKPQIYDYISAPMGMRHFGEKCSDQSSSTLLNTGKIPSEVFDEVYPEYRVKVFTGLRKTLDFLFKDIEKRGYVSSYLKRKINKRPVIYSGGGSSEAAIRRPVGFFSDVRHINQELLDIPNLRNSKAVTVPYSMLATCYGLSIASETDDVVLNSKEDMFANLKSQTSNYSGEYGLLDNH